MPVIEVDIKDNNSPEYWRGEVEIAVEERLCFLNERNGLHTDIVVTVKQQTDNSAKCSDEVLRTINYSKDSAHGRKIIEIIKQHFCATSSV